MALLCSLSCEDYLDKAPESTLTEEEVFKNFNNAQGFIEEMYVLVVDYGTAGHTFQDYMYGDDIYSPNTSKHLTSVKFDDGDLKVHAQKYSYLVDNTSQSNLGTGQNLSQKRFGVWNGSLKGIRKANLVISNVEEKGLMIDASQAERDVILGQAYFLRAFFHNEIMKFWGRFPYIDVVIDNDNYKLPRPETYKECALKADEDYKKAIELLPVNWDDEPYGQKTLGENRGRLTKGAAYAFQGKNLLLAASPLMHFNNGSDIDTYTYDTELCNRAVEAFAKVLELDDQGVYDLVPFDRYEEVFWKSPSKQVWAGSTEFIFCATGGKIIQAQRFMSQGMPRDIDGVGGSACTSPTHNFIYNNFGMANGLSIEDDLSGAYGTPTYDPTKPFAGRDPRFYKWITVDGDVLCEKASAPDEHKNAQLYVGGTHRKKNHSQTGYFYKKFYPTLHSKWNKVIANYAGIRLHMRLTDVYLMYAEALHAAKGSATTPSEAYNLTAEGTINILRDRVGIPHVHPSIVADPGKFMDELRRERSVELSFEAHRWVDIRRWGLAHLDRYRIKTSLDFPQDHSYFKETVLIKRVCYYPKHFWIPFEPNQTQFYEGFPQNPGW